MTGDYLYVEFKVALDYLDVGFHGMSEVDVALDKNQLVFSAGGRSYSIEIPPKLEVKSG